MSLPDQHLPYWIQSADYESEHFDPVSLEGALDIIRNHDWQNELDAQARIRADGQKAATPGIGIHHGPDTNLHLLHLCPEGEESWTVHYVYPETVRRFWFWKADINRRKSARGLSQVDVADATTCFFHDLHFDVLRFLERDT